MSKWFIFRWTITLIFLLIIVQTWSCVVNSTWSRMCFFSSLGMFSVIPQSTCKHPADGLSCLICGGRSFTAVERENKEKKTLYWQVFVSCGQKCPWHWIQVQRMMNTDCIHYNWWKLGICIMLSNDIFETCVTIIWKDKQCVHVRFCSLYSLLVVCVVMTNLDLLQCQKRILASC